MAKNLEKLPLFGGNKLNLGKLKVLLLLFFKIIKKTQTLSL